MMESSNLDHQHQQDLHGGSSSLTSPFFPLVGANHDWNQNLIVNNGNFIPNVSGDLSSSRDFRLSNQIPAPPLRAHMVEDLGLHWAGTPESYMNHSVHQANLARIKEELSDPRLHVLDERLFLRAFPSGCQTNGLQLQGGEFSLDNSSLGLASFGGATACGKGNYSMVLPTANVSTLNPPSSSPYPTSLAMDLQALDLLASARFGRSFCQPSFNSMALLREDIPFGLDHLQEPAQGPSNSHHKVPSLVGGTGSKRGGSVVEHEALQAVLKKPRFDRRSSCSPFKVRKEKLGDRIAALQQLVAPFGKTDTASVLMEAIGYIKFLQDQVETLSVPYMRTSNKKLRTSQGASSEDGDEPKPDLRSRGLCLVPLSCTSYVTNENGGVWSPPNYRGNN